MSIFRRKPKRFVAIDINHGRFQVIIPWAVYQTERWPNGQYKAVPRDIVKAHPELRLDYIMSKGSAKAAARWLNKHYPLDTTAQEG